MSQDVPFEIRTIKFTRKGKEVTMQVQVKVNPGTGSAWIRKANGKPFYGTTGYWNFEGMYAEPTVIKSYRQQVIVENVEFID